MTAPRPGGVSREGRDARLAAWVYVNGAWVAAEEARVLAADRGLLYGWGLFETIRVAGGRPVLLERHLDRLFRSAPVLGLELPWERAELAALAAEAVARNGLAEGALRLTVTAGPGPAPGPGGGPPGLVLAPRPGRPPEAAYARGWRAAVAAVRRNHLSPLARVKSLNYLDNLLARREAAARGADEALLLNAAGEVAEGATTNVFFVLRGRLCTPAPESGALPGVMRERVLAVASALLPVEEGRYRLAELAATEEAFLTNALLGVMPLVAVDGRPVGSGRPGPVTRELRRLLETAPMASSPE